MSFDCLSILMLLIDCYMIVVWLMGGARQWIAYLSLAYVSVHGGWIGGG